MRIGILEGDSFSSEAIQRLMELGSVDVFDGVSLSEFLVDKQILFVRLKYKIDRTFLSKASRLRILCSPTTGHNHIDIKALEERGIELISLKGESSFLEKIRATPEHTLGLILALLRKYHTAFRDQRNRLWNRDLFRGEELYGMNVGIIGLGRVGKILADYLHVIGSKIGYFDICPDITSSHCQRYSSLAKLISNSDLIVMCANYKEGSAPMLCRNHIKLLRGKYFVNTARGELVDEAALLELINDDGLKGVAIDVITNENGPNRLEEWLAAASDYNLIITPHIAGATLPSMAATEKFIVEKLEQQLRGRM